MNAIIISNYVCRHVHICVCACTMCSLFCVFDHVISRQSYAGIPLIRVTFLSCSFYLLWSQYITETSSGILNRYGQNMSPHLEVDLRRYMGNHFTPLIKDLAVDFSCMAFIILRYARCVFSLSRIFIMNGCWTFLKDFSPFSDCFTSLGLY